MLKAEVKYGLPESVSCLGRELFERPVLQKLLAINVMSEKGYFDIY